MHRRHILPKEGDGRWPQSDHAPRSYYPHNPIMAFPPYHSNPTLPASQLYPMWGAPPHPASVHLWGSPGYTPWQPPQSSWHWKPYPGVKLIHLFSFFFLADFMNKDRSKSRWIHKIQLFDIWLLFCFRCMLMHGVVLSCRRHLKVFVLHSLKWVYSTPAKDLVFKK